MEHLEPSCIASGSENKQHVLGCGHQGVHFSDLQRREQSWSVPSYFLLISLAMLVLLSSDWVCRAPEQSLYWQLGVTYPPTFSHGTSERPLTPSCLPSILHFAEDFYWVQSDTSWLLLVASLFPSHRHFARLMSTFTFWPHCLRKPH